MGSLATARFIPHDSKKRLFPGSSSIIESEAEVSSSSQPPKHKNKLLKPNEGVIISSKLTDIIEVDTEDGVFESHNSKHYIDLSCDDNISEDEYSILKSHNEKVDLPAGIEASVSPFLDSIKMKNELTSVDYSMYKLKHKRIKTSADSDMKVLEDVKLEEDFGKNPNDDDDVVRKYINFKKFDIVEDFTDHHYAASSSGTMQPTGKWAKKIQDEWKILKKDLPDMIFVRVCESRMDLLRAVIMGAEGTPYHNGLFFFDIYFPKTYPNDPPYVYYHSGGLRINPNLYNSGKVCLSLLNTWSGGKEERWTPGVSTMLQVLVSIQGMILNEKPYFNEPMYAHTGGSDYGENRSMLYNERILIYSLKTMVYTMKKPPKNFEDLVIGHFRDRAHGILTRCRCYMNGVGVDEGKEMVSGRFKNGVHAYMKTLIEAFQEIGCENVDEFMPPPLNFTQKIRSFFGF